MAVPDPESLHSRPHIVVHDPQWPEVEFEEFELWKDSAVWCNRVFRQVPHNLLEFVANFVRNM